MSAFEPTSNVLITGGNGHVAQHLVAHLLALPSDQRPQIRVTVRSDASRAALIQTFGPALDIMLIKDLGETSAWVPALDSVTYVAHLASPIIVGAKDIENELLIPAIRGTTAILEAISIENARRPRERPKIAKAVVTSSFGAVPDMRQGWWPGKTYDETSWNTVLRDEASLSVEELEVRGFAPKFAPFVSYCASKKFAEEAAWKEQARTGAFALTTILPTYIFGPTLLSTGTGAALSFSNQLVVRSIEEQQRSMIDWPHCVDVRDVARAHAEALLRPETDGERVLVTSGSFDYTMIADIAQRHKPEVAQGNAPAIEKVRAASGGAATQY